MTDQSVLNTIKEHLFPGMRCADVGASVGEVSLFMARLVGRTGKVTAFEPGDYGTRETAQNLHWVDAAVSMDHYSAFWSKDATNSNPNGGLVHIQTERPVKVLTLDSYFQEEDVDFIKIDTEGMDHQVIMGATRVIERCRPKIIYECIPAFAKQRHLPIYEIIELILAKYHYTLDKTRMKHDVLALP